MPVRRPCFFKVTWRIQTGMMCKRRRSCIRIRSVLSTAAVMGVHQAWPWLQLYPWRTQVPV